MSDAVNVAFSDSQTPGLAGYDLRNVVRLRPELPVGRRPFFRFLDELRAHSSSVSREPHAGVRLRMEAAHPQGFH